MPAALPFPKSLPDFQRIFPDDAACARYLEQVRFRNGFVCPACGEKGEPGLQPEDLAARRASRCGASAFVWIEYLVK